MINQLTPLAYDEIHVWEALNSDVDLDYAMALLTEEEKLRSSKFVFENDRLNFICGRTILRTLISAYSDLPLSPVEFQFNGQGKPTIDESYNLYFNISHSKDRLLVAFCRSSEIGVDIEWNKRPVEVDRIVGRFFSTQEIEELMRQPVDDKLATFYRCWTRKEAIIKTLGGGLSIPLDRFSVSLEDSDSPKLTSINWENNKTEDWRIYSFNNNPIYTGALAVKAKSITLKKFEWGTRSVTTKEAKSESIANGQ